MIKKDELTGARLKKALDLYKANQRWHNRNKSGGNFGFNLFQSPRHKFGKDYQLVGAYDTLGRVTSLTFGRLFQAGYKIDNLYDLTFERLIEVIKNRIDTIVAMDILCND